MCCSQTQVIYHPRYGIRELPHRRRSPAKLSRHMPQVQVLLPGKLSHSRLT